MFTIVVYARSVVASDFIGFYDDASMLVFRLRPRGGGEWVKSNFGPRPYTFLENRICQLRVWHAFSFEIRWRPADKRWVIFRTKIQSRIRQTVEKRIKRTGQTRAKPVPIYSVTRENEIIRHFCDTCRKTLRRTIYGFISRPSGVSSPGKYALSILSDRPKSWPVRNARLKWFSFL